MSDSMMQALRNAAASSAMEGMPLSEQDMKAVESIIDGKSSLQDYFDRIKKLYQEN